MASPLPHPRRSCNVRQPTRPLITHNFEDVASIQLKKGSTFHSPSSPSKENDPILSIPSLPKRSCTTLKELNGVPISGGERIARILGAVERSLSGLQSFANDSQETITAETFPVPSFMVNAHITASSEESMDVDSPSKPTLATRRDHVKRHHASDSGIGSTCTTSSVGDMKQASRDKTGAPAGTAQTGINGTSTLAADLATSHQHVLGEYACRQIQKHIILPIIREERLKAFHPLVSGLPHRIQRKEITCLRDLEKVLLWLAPKWSVSQAKFLQFCETSIQCIHATVEHLNEHDQRRPTDRPYTNGYFLDLVEQVRNYAAHLAATRTRAGPTDRVELRGGLSQTGRTAELVATRGGKTISLRTMEEVSAEEAKHCLKRTSAEIEDDLERSMARRRKSAPIEKKAQKCSGCEKIFSRPCDLTKHEKTHSRPWKCSEIGCKYHIYGWPTEKERDRHMNDKHSAAPSMYKCEYPPCPYESKRESNCKQHMEKAHGWVYVRSKSNGKLNASRPTGNGKSPPTPVNSTPGSHIFTAPTPEFRDDASNYGTPASSHYRTESLNGSVITTDLSGNYQNENLLAFDETFGPVADFNWGGTANAYDPAAIADFGNNSHRQSWDSAASMDDPNIAPSTFGAIPNEDESIFGTNFDWSNMDNDLTNLNLQLATPATSIKQIPLDVTEQTPLEIQTPSLSPGAHADAMLYSPYSMDSNEASIDEGYGDDFTQDLKPASDFSLFGSSNMLMNNNASEAMFQDLSAFGNGVAFPDYMQMEQ